MPISQALLPEFDHEMNGARRSLDRIPDGKFDWRPHPKSMPLGRLATHVAEIPGWAVNTIEQDELDLAPPGAPPYEPLIATTRKAVLEIFDKNIVAARAAIAGAADDHLFKNWSLLVGGKAVITMPRVAVLRGFILSHLIHHRAQLGVYLRLNDIAVPALYGPSADEGTM